MLGNKIKEVRKKLQLTQANLAKRAGIHQVSISDIETGKVPNPGFIQIMSIAKALRITPEELLGWKIIDRIAPIPIQGKAIASPEGAYYTDQDFPPGEAIEYIELKDKDAFALEVESDSMAPRIKPGDHIVIMPNKKAAQNGLCVVKLNCGKVFLKRVEITGNSAVLKSDNPDYPVLTIDMDKIEWIRRVECIIPK
jgi:repressor LexA